MTRNLKGLDFLRILQKGLFAAEGFQGKCFKAMTFRNTLREFFVTLELLRVFQKLLKHVLEFLTDRLSEKIHE